MEYYGIILFWIFIIFNKNGEFFVIIWYKGLQL